MKKSEVFLKVCIVIILLSKPFLIWLEVTVLKSDFKKAFAEYVATYCDVDIKLTKIKMDYIHGPMSYYKKWSAETRPEIKGIKGFL